MLTTVVSVPMHGLDLSKTVVSKLQLTMASNSAQKILRSHFFSSFLFFFLFSFLKLDCRATPIKGTQK